MAIWKAYVLFATLLLLIGTGNGQRGYELEATTRASPDQLYGNEEMSEEHEIKVGNKIEPIIFEPQRKIKLSRSTYKVTSYSDFKPYKQAFKQFGQYIRKFLADLHNPQYVDTLYKVGTKKDTPQTEGKKIKPTSFSQMVSAHSRPINVGFKINSFSLEMKQTKCIKFTGRLIGNS